MAGNLEGKSALVTGASQGIGRACALALAKAGAKVGIAARNQEKLRAVAAEIAAAGGEAEIFVLDVSSEESIKSVAKDASARLGGVHILVNNAGITRDTLLLRMKRSDWDDVLQTNLTGTFLLTQALVSGMMKARWGRIINISSVVGETGQAGQANYAASKAGLIGLTKSVAKEYASRNVLANVVAPGLIETVRQGAPPGHHAGPSTRRSSWPRATSPAATSSTRCARPPSIPGPSSTATSRSPPARNAAASVSACSGVTCWSVSPCRISTGTRTFRAVASGS